MKQLMVVVGVLLVLTGCKGKDANKEAVHYQQAKETLIEQEKNNPLSFISINGKSKRNFIGQSILKADVKNNATSVGYKKVRVKALYFKDGKLVTNHEDVIDKSIEAGETYHFRSKYFTPKGTDSVSLSIMSAEVE